MTPQNLETIRTTTLRAARRIRAHGLEVPAALLLFSGKPDGTLSEPELVTMMHLSKDAQAAMHQGAATLPNIAAAVLVIEAWICTLAPGEEIPESVKARPDREEVLIVNVLTAQRQYLMTAKIHGESIEESPLVEVNAGGNETMVGRYIRENPPAPRLQ